MRYQNLKSFRKHLASAAPHHLCRCYVIATGDDYERKKGIDAILTTLAPSFGANKVEDLSSLLETLQSPPLFGGEPIVWMDGAEKFSKSDQQALSHFLATPLNMGYLILGIRSTKVSFLGAIEKQGVILDLVDEKPWDKEKRLFEQMEERVKRSGKRLASDVPPLLFEKIGHDSSLLDQEIDKLLCYTGERPTIERADVLRLTGLSRQATVWQMADEIIWEKGEISLPADLFHPLIPALRSQLQLGLKIATLIETGVPSDQWASHLPKIWPKTLEKRTTQASQKGVIWFRKGLELLFEIELLSRDGSSHTEALLDLFRLRMLTHG